MCCAFGARDGDDGTSVKRRRLGGFVGLQGGGLHIIAVPLRSIPGDGSDGPLPGERGAYAADAGFNGAIVAREAGR